MNVLIFVMTMLMLLTLMTYAKMETYRSSQIFQVLFEHYMQKDERGYINLAAEKTYETIKKVAKAENEDKDQKSKKAPKAQGNSRISIWLLGNKAQREAKPQEWLQSKLLLKNLMSVLYKNQPFYVEMEKENPQFLEDLISAIVQDADALPKEKKWKKTQDIANLKLSDPKLNEVLYLMGKGAPYKDIGEKQDQIQTPEMTKAVGESDDPADPVDTNEFKSPKGYYSLFDFVTLSHSQKIRVYLAPREVLQAVFNEATANDIIIERKQLYNQIKAGGDPVNLSKGFQERYDNARDPGINRESLDYTVSKTNPKSYE